VRWPIRLQILIPFVILQMAAVVTLSVIAASAAIRRAEREAGLRLGQTVRTLSSLRTNFTPRVLEQLKNLASAEVVLRDPQGQVEQSTLPIAASMSLPPREELENLDFSRLADAPRVSSQDESYLVASVPLETSPLGDLLLLVPETAWRSQRWESAQPPLIVGAITLLLVVGISVWLSSRFARRIRTLEGQVAEIASGNFIPLPLPQTHDELRELGASVNRMSESLRQMRDQIRATERAGLIAQLAGGLAHQLRNAITGARMAVQLHQRKCEARNDDSLQVALRQLSLTEEQVKGILTLHRREHPSPVAAQLAVIVEDVRQLVLAACQHAGVSLAVAADIPTLTIRDSDAIRAALLNLVLNAIEASGSGGQVEIRAAQSDGQIELEVIDNGPGVPSGVGESVFNPFVTTKPEGVGLGLALANQAAEAHRGRLLYTRRDDRTVFTLRLPMSPAAG
jgi:signal transduction histidine kinase